MRNVDAASLTEAAVKRKPLSTSRPLDQGFLLVAMRIGMQK